MENAYDEIKFWYKAAKHGVNMELDELRFAFNLMYSG